jgi:hypothetical protein
VVSRIPWRVQLACLATWPVAYKLAKFANLWITNSLLMRCNIAHLITSCNTWIIANCMAHWAWLSLPCKLQLEACESQGRWSHRLVFGLWLLRLHHLLFHSRLRTTVYSIPMVSLWPHFSPLGRIDDRGGWSVGGTNVACSPLIWIRFPWFQQLIANFKQIQKSDFTVFRKVSGDTMFSKRFAPV